MEDVVTGESVFWRGRRVLVTGHTGFKGAWLWLLLRRVGAEPIGLALTPEAEPNLFSLAGLDGEPNSHIVDIRDPASVKAVIADTQPEIVIHMAAQSLVRRSYALPVETYATNVMGTIHLLEAARQCPSLRAIVVVTSDKCYVNREWLWPYREDEALGGHDPYSSSKACVEILTESWRSSFLNGNECNVAVASSRAGNVIGGGDWADERLIPDCVRAFTAGRSVELRNPGAVRPWQHVLDPLVGYLTLAQALLDNPAEAAQAWNFGPFETDTDRVANVVDQFARLWGGSARWCVNSDTQPHEASILRLDATKARERLGWRPRLNLATAIAWTAEWYREWASGKLAGNLCSDQIERYLSMDQQ